MKKLAMILLIVVLLLTACSSTTRTVKDKFENQFGHHLVLDVCDKNGCVEETVTVTESAYKVNHIGSEYRSPNPFYTER